MGRDYEYCFKHISWCGYLCSRAHFCSGEVPIVQGVCSRDFAYLLNAELICLDVAGCVEKAIGWLFMAYDFGEHQISWSSHGFTKSSRP